MKMQSKEDVNKKTINKINKRLENISLTNTMLKSTSKREPVIQTRRNKKKRTLDETKTKTLLKTSPRLSDHLL